MKSNSQVHIDSPWSVIRSAINTTRGRTVAAVAYVTKELLDLSEGDFLVCDSSEASVRSGRTDPKVLLRYLRKGCLIFNCPGLHAKAIARGDVAIVGSANSSNASSEGLLLEMVTVVRGRLVTDAVRGRIEQIRRRSTTLDPVTLKRLAKIFTPGREFSPRRAPGSRRLINKVRAWCIGTHYTKEDSRSERTRSRGTSKATTSAGSILGRSWRARYLIDDRINWGSSDIARLELGDQIFDVVERSHVRFPGVLVHKELHGGVAGGVLFICREKRRRDQPFKIIRKKVDKRTCSLLKRAAMRQLTAKQLERVNDAFPSS